MEKKRIQVYTNGELKRRIELAAAKHNVATTEYCLAAIVQQLADDELLEAEQVTLPVRPVKDEGLIAELQALQERIKTRRGGKPIQLDHIMEEMREAREYELIGLR